MIKNITSDDIKNAVLKNNITAWYPFRCSICDEPYGYYFYNGIVTIAYNANLEGVGAHCLNYYLFRYWHWAE